MILDATQLLAVSPVVVFKFRSDPRPFLTVPAEYLHSLPSPSTAPEPNSTPYVPAFNHPLKTHYVSSYNSSTEESPTSVDQRYLHDFLPATPIHWKHPIHIETPCQPRHRCQCHLARYDVKIHKRCCLRKNHKNWSGKTTKTVAKTPQKLLRKNRKTSCEKSTKAAAKRTTKAVVKKPQKLLRKKHKSCCENNPQK